MSVKSLLALIAVIFTCTACTRDEQKVASAAAPAAAPQAVAMQDVAASAPAAGSVKRIVFLDKQEACACTRERVDKSWAELQKALGEGNSMPVERIFVDTQHEVAQKYEKMSPVMVLPGVYLLDDKGQLVELLQGELSEDAIAAKL